MVISGRDVLRIELSCRGCRRGEDGGGMVDCGPSKELEVVSILLIPLKKEKASSLWLVIWCLCLPGESMGSFVLSLDLHVKGKRKKSSSTSGFRVEFQSKTR